MNQKADNQISALHIFRKAKMLNHILKVLGYSKFVSIESFRKPNFKLIADILYWLCLKLEPNTEISTNINGESERIVFIKSTVSLLVFHTRIQMNPLNLYYSDHRAIIELLKVLEIFHQGYKFNSSSDDIVSEFSLPLKFDKRLIKDIAKGITDSGLKIYELLDRENELKIKREQSMTILEGVLKDYNDTNVNIDGHVKKLINEQLKNNSEMEEYYRSLELKEKELLDKIKKRKIEMERSEKKYKSISKIKPAYVEELERHEKELERIYQIYLDKTRNLYYLEDLFEKINIKDQDKQGQIKKYLEKMQMSIKNKEDKIFDHNIDKMMILGDKEHSKRLPSKQVKSIMEEHKEEDEEYVY